MYTVCSTYCMLCVVRVHGFKYGFGFALFSLKVSHTENKSATQGHTVVEANCDIYSQSKESNAVKFKLVL